MKSNLLKLVIMGVVMVSSQLNGAATVDHYCVDQIVYASIKSAKRATVKNMNCTPGVVAVCQTIVPNCSIVSISDEEIKSRTVQNPFEVKVQLINNFKLEDKELTVIGLVENLFDDKNKDSLRCHIETFSFLFTKGETNDKYVNFIRDFEQYKDKIVIKADVLRGLVGKIYGCVSAPIKENIEFVIKDKKLSEPIMLKIILTRALKNRSN